jgi:hypothetical protein
MQTTSNLLMIRPVYFGFNPETAVNNAFQVPGAGEESQANAVLEFDHFVQLLQASGIDVTVVMDTPEPHTPDSIFPNNWISFHQDGTICLYPMFAKNRRQERKPDVIEAITKKFVVKKTIDFSYYEQTDLYLEGTGSMVLDRDKKISYACFSPRTCKKPFQAFCEQMGYRGVGFYADDAQGQPIYHTNVMMCVADKFIVICLDAFRNKDEKEQVVSIIKGSGKAIVDINLEQMNHFAGNMLEVHNKEKRKYLIMSTQAYESLTPKQIKKLSSHNEILHSNLKTIETNGGGSARCMMAEIHLPERSDQLTGENLLR